MMKAALICLSFLLAACGQPGEGESCEGSNSTDACDDGLVCTKEAKETVCRLMCDDPAVVCPDGTACNGISGGSHKSCQPKTTPVP